MNKKTSYFLLVLGLVFFVFGLAAYHSSSSDSLLFFKGVPPDKALRHLISGAAAGLVGFFGLVRK